MKEWINKATGLLLLLLPTIVLGQQQNQPCDGNLGENVFTIGDFGSGTANIGFFNPNLGLRFGNYQYASRDAIPPTIGFFTLTNDMSEWEDLPFYWMPLGDNSPDPDGYMLVVNARPERNTIFFEADITGLCGNTTYRFSMDAINIMFRWCCGLPGKKIPLVTVLLDGQEYFLNGQVHQREEWYTFEFTFTTPPGVNEMKLQLRNDNTGGADENGNDLAIDNIEIRSCGPADFIDTEPNNFFCVTDFDPLPITAAADSSYLVQWQLSRDNGASWVDLPGETNKTVFHQDFNAGNYTYRYLAARTPEALNSPQCRTISDVVEVEVQPLTHILFDTICMGSDYVFGDQVLTQSGTYQGRFTSLLAGCDSLVTLNLTFVEDRMEVAFSSEPPGCFGDTAGVIRVDPIANVAFPLRQWINGVPFEGSSLERLSEGEYLVEVEDRYGCREETIFELSIIDTFSIEMGPDIVLDFGELSPSVSVQSNRDLGWVNWLPGDGLVFEDSTRVRIEGTQKRTYIVEAESLTGCYSRDTLEVFLRIDAARIFIPNAFSPNDDGANDLFWVYPFDQTVQRVLSLKVFNRWGNQVFEQQDQDPAFEQAGWDGKLDGRLLPNGEYVYVFEFELLDGSQVQRTGSVTLMR